MTDRMDIPSAFSQESKKIIRQLEDYGWTFTLGSKGHALGKAPDGKTTTSISRTLSRANRSQQAAEATVKRWERHLAAQEQAKTVGVLIEAIGDGPIDPVVDGVISQGLRKHAERAVAGLMEVQDTDPPVPVSRKPWLARQGTHRSKGTTSLYESGAVIEVTYSDGSLMFECSMESCDYTSDNPRSVSSHFRAHVRSGEADPVGHLARPSVAKDVPVTDFRDSFPGKGYKPTDRLLEMLSSFLADQSWDNVDDLALLILTWQHDRLVREGADSVRESLTGPLTDTQIVERIRLLVGGRDPETEEAYRNALATVEQMRVDHAAEVQRLNELLDLSNAEVVRLAQAFDTLGSLAREVGVPRLGPPTP